jgi:hypothetical protein
MIWRIITWLSNNSKPKWSSYGAACLTTCKYPFPLKSFHFWILNNLFLFFFIFILVAILKILKTKSTTLSADLFLCQVSKGSAVRREFNIFCTLATMATAAILNFFQHLKSCHTLRWIFLQSFMKFDERNKRKLNSPLFCFHGNCGKVCLTDSDFFWPNSFH